MAKLLVTILGIVFSVFSSVLCRDVFKLTDEEYHQMPQLFQMDPYERCISQPANAYCQGVFELSPSGSAPSKLFDNMKKYSEDTQKNFNHTRLHRAVCIGPSTKCDIANGSLESSFESCVNRNMQNEYGFEAKLIRLLFCRRSNERRPVDGASKAFIVYFVLILILNASGTVYDKYFRDEESDGNAWLMAFSLSHNWKKLTAMSKEGDPRLQNLSCFNGIKAASMLLVHMAHAVMVLMHGYVANPRFMEEATSGIGLPFIANGTMIVQIFFFITNFILAYRMLIYAEKNKMDLKLLPKLIVDRLFRIYPLQLTVIAFVATLAVYSSDGPMWPTYAYEEADFCRDYWWHHILFIHNLFPPKCVPQTWSLAADVQIYIVSCALMLWIIGGRRNAERVLIQLLFSSIALVFVINYWLELEPSLKLNKPETILFVYEDDKSFVLSYTPGWANLPSAILGLLFACIYYRLEINKVDLSKNKAFLTFYRLSVPLCVLWSVCGSYLINSLDTRFLASLYGAIDRPVYSLIASGFILGCLYKIDGILKNIFEWSGWLPISRISLGALLMHVFVNKTMAMSRLGPSTLSLTNIASEWIAVSVLTYALVLPLSLLVEFPAANIYKLLSTPKKVKVTPKYIVNENNNIIEPISNGKSKIM